ncbi:hypothetical protein TYRP_014705 [Tyrophagus putrescentiae]|nr:hypothetical protein TYRP_014705 [Tyrophagus putrescentiae]
MKWGTCRHGFASSSCSSSSIALKLGYILYSKPIGVEAFGCKSAHVTVFFGFGAASPDFAFAAFASASSAAAAICLQQPSARGHPHCMSCSRWGRRTQSMPRGGTRRALLGQVGDQAVLDFRFHPDEDVLLAEGSGDGVAGAAVAEAKLHAAAERAEGGVVLEDANGGQPLQRHAVHLAEEAVRLHSLHMADVQHLRRLAGGVVNAVNGDGHRPDAGVARSSALQRLQVRTMRFGFGGGIAIGVGTVLENRIRLGLLHLGEINSESRGLRQQIRRQSLKGGRSAGDGSSISSLSSFASR